MPPEFYASRFCDFICSRIVTVDEYRSISSGFNKNITDDHFVHMPEDDQYSLSRINVREV